MRGTILGGASHSDTSHALATGEVERFLNRPNATGILAGVEQH